MIRTAVLLAAVLAAALPAALAQPSAGLLGDLGAGAPGAVNCTPSSGLEGFWLETTQVHSIGGQEGRRGGVHMAGIIPSARAGR